MLQILCTYVMKTNQEEILYHISLWILKWRCYSICLTKQIPDKKKKVCLTQFLLPALLQPLIRCAVWGMLCICNPCLASCARLRLHCGKEMLDQLNFLLKSHSSYLPPLPISSLFYFSLSPGECTEVQIYGAAQSLVATIQPEQVICSEVTDTEDRERSVNDAMDRSPGVCVWEKERKNVGVNLEVVSTLLDKGCQPYALLSSTETVHP